MKYTPGLDGVRAVAVLAVLGAHTQVPFLKGGGLGVRLFFALSGFLITTLLIQERVNRGRVDVIRFYGRRALRLAPALILVGIVVALWIGGGDGGREDTYGLVGAAVYVTNWMNALTSHPGGVMAHTWSLGVEEQFYLLWPLVLLLVWPRWRAQGVAAVAVVGAVLAPALRAVLWASPADTQRVYTGLDCSADQLLWGCALAAMAVHRRAVAVRVCRWLFWPAAGVLLAVLFHGGADSWRYVVFGYAAQAMAGAVVVGRVVLIGGLAARVFGVGPLPWLGRISYGYYLWHYPLITLLPEVESWAVRFVMVGLATLLVAWLSFRFLERPLQQRFRPLVVPGARPIPASTTKESSAA